jgi:hypothetical protein
MSYVSTAREESQTSTRVCMAMNSKYLRRVLSNISRMIRFKRIDPDADAYSFSDQR